jgi:putative ATP-dependent endonuclease of OLD family
VKVLDGLEGFDAVKDITDALDLDTVLKVGTHLRQFGVFFTAPLDLDHAMLCEFWSAYTTLNDGA